MLLWVLLSISYSISKAQPLDPNQIYNTGNLVLPTPYGGPTPWVSGVYQNELTCWAWGYPGYCGPNPIVRPGNDINFSYGWTDLYQQQNIGNLLPNSGTGLQVNGYNFSFTAKNGNSWDDERTDKLYAYVQFNNPTGGILLNHTHNLTYGFNWTNFNYNQTFNTPYKVGEIGSVRYGFVGQDNNYWAGPYGPEINNVSFSLKYSVDPCTVNVLSSPSCPGYLTELAKLSTPTPVVQAVQEPTIVAAPVEILTPTQTSQPLQQSVTQSSVLQTPRIEQERKQGPNTSTILGIVRNIQQNISSVERSAVQTATSESSTAATNSIQESLTVASQAQTNSIQIANQASLNSFTTNFQPLGTGLVVSSINTLNNNAFKGLEVEIPLTENKFLTNRSDPINQILETKTEDSSQNNSQQSISVKRNVPNNELAGAVNIAALATTPPGYDLYSMALKDAPFYPPKEIYKNQNVVDNERLLRQLNVRSDRLHREMVEQQYR